MPYLCNPVSPNAGCRAPDAHLHTAEIAQLVEHDLAKVGVASSSLVFRSNEIDNPRGCLFSFVETRTMRPLSLDVREHAREAGSSLVFRSKTKQQPLWLLLLFYENKC